MSFLSFRSEICVIATSLFLAACGGGGGDGSDAPSTIKLKFDVDNISATFFQNQQKYINADDDPDVSIEFTAEGLVDGTVYARVEDSGQIFGGSSVVLTRITNNRFSAALRAKTSLSPGIYSGTLNTRVCKDPECVTEYQVDGGRLPYGVTLTPQLALAVYVDGVLVASPTSSDNLATIERVKGRQIRIASNVPITIRADNQPGSYEFIVDPASTPVNWVAQVNTSSGLFSGTFVTVRAGDVATRSQRSIILDVTF